MTKGVPKLKMFIVSGFAWLSSIDDVYRVFRRLSGDKCLCEVEEPPSLQLGLSSMEQVREFETNMGRMGVSFIQWQYVGEMCSSGSGGWKEPCGLIRHPEAFESIFKAS